MPLFAAAGKATAKPSEEKHELPRKFSSLKAIKSDYKAEKKVEYESSEEEDEYMMYAKFEAALPKRTQEERSERSDRIERIEDIAEIDRKGDPDYFLYEKFSQKVPSYHKGSIEKEESFEARLLEAMKDRFRIEFIGGPIKHIHDINEIQIQDSDSHTFSTPSDPQNIELWIKFIHSADCIERRLSICEKALKSNENNPCLLKEYMRCFSQLSDYKQSILKWKQVLAKCPSLWQDYLLFVLHSGSFKFSCWLSSVQQSPQDIKLEMMELLSKVMWHAGFKEKALLMLACQLALTMSDAREAKKLFDNWRNFSLSSYHETEEVEDGLIQKWLKCERERERCIFYDFEEDPHCTLLFSDIEPFLFSSNSDSSFIVLRLLDALLNLLLEFPSISGCSTFDQILDILFPSILFNIPPIEPNALAQVLVESLIPCAADDFLYSVLGAILIKISLNPSSTGKSLLKQRETVMLWTAYASMMIPDETALKISNQLAHPSLIRRWNEFYFVHGLLDQITLGNSSDRKSLILETYLQKSFEAILCFHDEFTYVLAIGFHHFYHGFHPLFPFHSLMMRNDSSLYPIELEMMRKSRILPKNLKQRLLLFPSLPLLLHCKKLCLLSPSPEPWRIYSLFMAVKQTLQHCAKYWIELISFCAFYRIPNPISLAYEAIKAVPYCKELYCMALEIIINSPDSKVDDCIEIINSMEERELRVRTLLEEFQS